MGAGREARAADVPDHVALLDSAAGTNPLGEARQMQIGGEIAVGLGENLRKTGSLGKALKVTAQEVFKDSMGGGIKVLKKRVEDDGPADARVPTFSVGGGILRRKKQTQIGG